MDIAVITAARDAHLPFVQAHLDRPLIVLDRSSVIRGSAAAYYFAGGTASTVYNGRPIGNLKSIWFRKPDFLRPESIPVPDEMQQYALSALNRFDSFIRGQFPDCFWLSSPYDIMRAEDKTLQMRLAHDLGFHVPDTCITSSPAIARRFVQSQSGNVVAKAISHTSYTIDGISYALSTHILEENDGLQVAPVMFQQAIDVVCEFRVTVVGKQVFAACIVDDSQFGDDSLARDWRLNQIAGRTHFTACELQPAVADRCMALVCALNMQYGAIDLIVDKRGRFWFLENNPNGQWAFIEQDTGLPIGKAIAGLLLSGGKKR